RPRDELRVPRRSASRQRSDTAVVVASNLSTSRSRYEATDVGRSVQQRLTCYDIKGPQKTEAQSFGLVNQFESDTYTVTSWNEVCVPTEMDRRRALLTPCVSVDGWRARRSSDTGLGLIRLAFGLQFALAGCRAGDFLRLALDLLLCVACLV